MPRENSQMSNPNKQNTTTLPVNEKSPAQRTPSIGEKAWEEKTLAPVLSKSPERHAEFTTISGHPIRRLYTEADLSGWNAETDLGYPGDPPFARGSNLGNVPRRRGKTRSGLEENLWYFAERHPQGIHRAEGIHLSA